MLSHSSHYTPFPFLLICNPTANTAYESLFDPGRKMPWALYGNYPIWNAPNTKKGRSKFSNRKIARSKDTIICYHILSRLNPRSKLLGPIWKKKDAMRKLSGKHLIRKITSVKLRHSTCIISKSLYPRPSALHDFINIKNKI